MKRSNKVIFEKVCKRCSKPFHSKDQEMIFCPDCWAEYVKLIEENRVGFYHYDEDLKKEIYEEFCE